MLLRSELSLMRVLDDVVLLSRLVGGLSIEEEIFLIFLDVRRLRR